MKCFLLSGWMRSISEPSLWDQRPSDQCRRVTITLLAIQVKHSQSRRLIKTLLNFRYTGICLPKNILDLFHTDSPSVTYVSQFAHDSDLQSRLQHRSTHVQLSASFSVVDAFSEDDPQPGSVSSLSDTSSATAGTVNKRSSAKWTNSKHHRSACLLCCRQSPSMRSNSVDTTDNVAQPAHIPRRRNSSQTDGFTLNRTPSSFDDLLPPSPFDIANDSSSVTDHILRHVQRMANPVWSKQSKMALLEMKQKHPSAFQDVCLYAEVCRLISNNTYRMFSRRFLQEIFLDLNFDSFNTVAAEICLRREREMALLIGGIDSVDGGRKTSVALHRTTTQFNGNVAVTAAATAAPVTTATTAGSALGVIPNDHIYVNVKPHLRHPQLASVFETSVENLAESLGNRNKPLATR